MKIYLLIGLEEITHDEELTRTILYKKIFININFRLFGYLRQLGLYVFVSSQFQIFIGHVIMEKNLSSKNDNS